MKLEEEEEEEEVEDEGGKKRVESREQDSSGKFCELMVRR